MAQPVREQGSFQAHAVLHTGHEPVNIPEQRELALLEQTDKREHAEENPQERIAVRRDLGEPESPPRRGPRHGASTKTSRHTMSASRSKVPMVNGLSRGMNA